MAAIKNCLPIIIVLLLCAGVASSQGNSPTAEQIIQRSITNAGGAKKLDSITCIETITRLVTAQKDTISVAVKRSIAGYYYMSVLGKGSANSTIIYNRGSAVILSGDTASQLIDPLKLEEFKLQTYISIDYAYKKLGYRFERLEDQHFTNTDLYQLKVTSPLGNVTLNCYEKRTGNLTMISYPNGNKTIITDYHKDSSIAYPSEIMMIDTLNNLTRSALTYISLQRELDPDWFLLPAAGLARMPAELQTGEFVYVGANEGSVITRDQEKQVESGSDSRIEYKVKWENANSYLLYDLKDPASLPVTANIRDIMVKISSWNGRRYYCHYVTSGKDAGTCVFEKIK